MSQRIFCLFDVEMAPKPRGKCVFNSDLAKKYPFMKIADGKTTSDVVCEICNAEFNIANAGKSSIEQHLKVSKHTAAVQAKSSSRTVPDYFATSTDYTVAAYEGVWAFNVIEANHSFLSSDCASKLFRTCFEMRKFHCARTKCEAIVTNVFSPYANEILQKDLSQRNFVCISTDASNHGNIKMMPVVFRFFNPTVGVRVKLLEFSSEKGESSSIISSLIKATAEKNGISDKIVGFCGDNCATNFGSRDRGGENNVFYRLKQWRPSLIGVGCAAHIVHNALKSACDCLPIDMECIVVKIYSHFYIYTVRVEKLKSFCDSIEGVEYSQLLGYAKTRFLALGPAIGSILKMFEPLKEYFLSLKNCPVILRTFFNSAFSKLWILFVKDQVIAKLMVNSE